MGLKDLLTRSESPERNNANYRVASATEKGVRKNDQDSIFTDLKGFEFGGVTSEQLNKALRGLKILDSKKNIVDTVPNDFDVEQLKALITDYVKQGVIKAVDILSDGAGGMASGEMASAIFTAIFCREVIKIVQSGKPATRGILYEAANMGNRAVRSWGETNRARAMATYVTHVVDSNGRSIFLGKGDAAVYLISPKGEVTRIFASQSNIESDAIDNPLTYKPSLIHTLPSNNIHQAAGLGDDTLRLDRQQSGEHVPSQKQVIQYYDAGVLPKGTKVILCCDGVWKVDVKDPEVKKVLEDLDKEYEDKIRIVSSKDKGRPPTRDVAQQFINEHAASLFKKVNLKGISSAKPGNLVKSLTSVEQQRISRDNVSAICREVISEPARTSSSPLPEKVKVSSPNTRERVVFAAGRRPSLITELERMGKRMVGGKTCADWAALIPIKGQIDFSKFVGFPELEDLLREIAVLEELEEIILQGGGDRAKKIRANETSFKLVAGESRQQYADRIYTWIVNQTDVRIVLAKLRGHHNEMIVNISLGTLAEQIEQALNESDAMKLQAKIERLPTTIQQWVKKLRKT